MIPDVPKTVTEAVIGRSDALEAAIRAIKDSQPCGWPMPKSVVEALRNYGSMSYFHGIRACEQWAKAMRPTTPGGHDESRR